MRYLIAILLAVVFITAGVAVANDNDAPRGFLRATIEAAASGVFTGDLTLENIEAISNSTDGLVCIEGNGGAFDQDICIDLDGSGVIVISAPAGATSINWGSLDHTMGDLTLSGDLTAVGATLSGDLTVGGPINEASSTSMDLGINDGCMCLENATGTIGACLCVDADGRLEVREGDGTTGSADLTVIDRLFFGATGNSWITGAGGQMVLHGNSGVSVQFGADAGSPNSALLYLKGASAGEATNGSQLAYGARVDPWFRQTGTAGYHVIGGFATEQTLGSGVHHLIHVGSTSQADAFVVDNVGNTTMVGNLTVGVAAPDDVQPSFLIIGDADSDAGGDTSETFQLVLNPNADPTLATWDFTSTQSAGYTFDKTVAITGDLTVTGTIGGAGFTSWKSYSHSTGNSGSHYIAGSYGAPAAEMVLNQGALTQTYGAANNAYGAHVFFVAKGDGVTDGSTLVVTVTGVSITDAGVKNDSDSEVIIGAGADVSGCANGGIIANLATDVYCETQKKWLGQVTYTLSSSGGSTFNLSGNYGRTKYDDFGNKDLLVTDFECTWHASANESNFGLILFHHNVNNWTYSAGSFVPGGTQIANIDTDYGGNDEFDTGEYGAYKRAGMSEAVTGNNGEGMIINFSNAVNNSIIAIDCHIGVTFN